MAIDPTATMKARIRDDLVAAMKGKHAEEVALLRSLLAAIDDAEAPAARSALGSMIREPSEVDRLVLTDAELRAVIAGESAGRRRAASELAGLGQHERAEALLRQAALAERYLMPRA